LDGEFEDLGGAAGLEALAAGSGEALGTVSAAGFVAGFELALAVELRAALDSELLLEALFVPGFPGAGF
jgi:hypothetical protein